MKRKKPAPFKTEINPWADALRGCPPAPKSRTVRVLVTTRDKTGKLLNAKIYREKIGS